MQTLIIAAPNTTARRKTTYYKRCGNRVYIAASPEALRTLLAQHNVTSQQLASVMQRAIAHLGL
jgi:hypothetical protein